MRRANKMLHHFIGSNLPILQAERPHPPGLLTNPGKHYITEITFLQNKCIAFEQKEKTNDDVSRTSKFKCILLHIVEVKRLGKLKPSEYSIKM